MKKLTSERLGREGLAAWGAPKTHSDQEDIEENEEVEIPVVKDDVIENEITLVLPSPDAIYEEPHETEKEPPPQKGKKRC